MADFTDAQYFLNRECTWVKFNERVLREAIVPSNPLLEQLNFIAIAASNLDEFFMIASPVSSTSSKAGSSTSTSPA